MTLLRVPLELNYQPGSQMRKGAIKHIETRKGSNDSQAVN